MVTDARHSFWCSAVLFPLAGEGGRSECVSEWCVCEGEWGVYSLVCLILNPTCSPWPEDWGQAAWLTHTRQDLSPMHVWGQSELHLPVSSVPPSQGPARGTESHFYDLGQNICPARLFKAYLLGQYRIREALREPGHLLPVCPPRRQEAQRRGRAARNPED